MNDSKISLGNEYKKTFFNEKFVVKLLDGNVNIILVRFREENISVSKQIIYPITLKKLQNYIEKKLHFLLKPNIRMKL